MTFFIKVKKTYWKELHFKPEHAEKIKQILEADEVEFMTEYKTRTEMLKNNPVPLMEMNCGTCKSLVENPYPMQHECRKKREFVKLDQCCLDWRASKRSAEKRIYDFEKRKKDGEE